MKLLLTAILLGIIALTACTPRNNSLSMGLYFGDSDLCQQKGFNTSCGGHMENGEAIIVRCCNGKNLENQTAFCLEGKNSQCNKAKAYGLEYQPWNK